MGEVKVVRNYAKSVRLFLTECLKMDMPWDEAWALCEERIKPWQPDWYKEQDGSTPHEVCHYAMEKVYKEMLVERALGGTDYEAMMEEV